MSAPDRIQLNASDNVQVLTTEVGGIPRGHKIAARAIAKGEPVFKFGHLIGVATDAIAAGAHVHTQNVKMPTMDEIRRFVSPTETASPANQAGKLNASVLGSLPKTFQGYLRANGEVGTRNYVVVAASVNCSSSVVKAVCRQFEGQSLAEKNIDGVIPVTHTQGCAQEIGGQGYEILNRTLAGWITHPNVVGAVVIGLGCEGTTFKSIVKASTQGRGPTAVEHLGIQEVGGTAAAIQAGIAAVERVLAKIPPQKRTPQPVSKLKLALNCGGSDAFSSLTANPVLGLASDYLTANGGTVALAEIPECHGCEDLLDHRSKSAGVREKLKAVFAWWQDYTTRHKVDFNDNLAPGNIAGGITTIIEKSLGAVAKAGTSSLNQVVGYSELITEPGFVLMNTPGFDPVSVTGLVAGGCNLVTFTTGRGSVYGCGIAPTVKIATTSELFKRMSGDMDFDAGVVLSGGTMEKPAGDLYRLLVQVASGEVLTCSEKLHMGWEEFVPWAVAETL